MMANNFFSFSKRRFSAMPKLASTFRASDLTVHPVDVKKIKPMAHGQFGFGRQFTDHMLTIDWSKEGGWEAPKIIPHGPLDLETSATSLHYGISCYEGISVCKNSQTGKLQGFRVNDHMNSLLNSTAHLDMPAFDANELVDCLKPLIKLDRDWIDHYDEPDQFYTRLLHISTDKTLGVRTPQFTKLVAFLNPIQLPEKELALKCSS